MNGLKLFFQDLTHGLSSKSIQNASTSQLHTSPSTRRFWSFFEFSRADEKLSKRVFSKETKNNKRSSDLRIPRTPVTENFSFSLKTNPRLVPKKRHLYARDVKQSISSFLDGNPAIRDIKLRVKTCQSPEAGDVTKGYQSEDFYPNLSRISAGNLRELNLDNIATKCVPPNASKPKNKEETMSHVSLRKPRLPGLKKHGDTRSSSRTPELPATQTSLSSFTPSSIRCQATSWSLSTQTFVYQAKQIGCESNSIDHELRTYLSGPNSTYDEKPPYSSSSAPCSAKNQPPASRSSPPSCPKCPPPSMCESTCSSNAKTKGGNFVRKCSPPKSENSRKLSNFENIDKNSKIVLPKVPHVQKKSNSTMQKPAINSCNQNSSNAFFSPSNQSQPVTKSFSLNIPPKNDTSKLDFVNSRARSSTKFLCNSSQRGIGSGKPEGPKIRSEFQPPGAGGCNERETQENDVVECKSKSGISQSEDANFLKKSKSALSCTKESPGREKRSFDKGKEFSVQGKKNSRARNESCSGKSKSFEKPGDSKKMKKVANVKSPHDRGSPRAECITANFQCNANKCNANLRRTNSSFSSRSFSVSTFQTRNFEGKLKPKSLTYQIRNFSSGSKSKCTEFENRNIPKCNDSQSDNCSGLNNKYSSFPPGCFNETKGKKTKSSKSTSSNFQGSKKAAPKFERKQRNYSDLKNRSSDCNKKKDICSKHKKNCGKDSKKKNTCLDFNKSSSRIKQGCNNKAKQKSKIPIFHKPASESTKIGKKDFCGSNAKVSCVNDLESSKTSNFDCVGKKETDVCSNFDRSLACKKEENDVCSNFNQSLACKKEENDVCSNFNKSLACKREEEEDNICSKVKKPSMSERKKEINVCGNFNQTSAPKKKKIDVCAKFGKTSSPVDLEKKNLGCFNFGNSKPKEDRVSVTGCTGDTKQALWECNSDEEPPPACENTALECSKKLAICDRLGIDSKVPKLKLNVGLICTQATKAGRNGANCKVHCAKEEDVCQDGPCDSETVDDIIAREAKEVEECKKKLKKRPCYDYSDFERTEGDDKEKVQRCDDECAQINSKYKPAPKLDASAYKKKRKKATVQKDSCSDERPKKKFSSRNWGNKDFCNKGSRCKMSSLCSSNFVEHFGTPWKNELPKRVIKEFSKIRFSGDLVPEKNENGRSCKKGEIPESCKKKGVKG